MDYEGAEEEFEAYLEQSGGGGISSGQGPSGAVSGRDVLRSQLVDKDFYNDFASILDESDTQSKTSGK
jgi:hypothetical protein